MLPQFILVTGLWIAPARDVRQSCPRKTITNPPFRRSEQCVIRHLDVAREGVAILARTTFIESVGRNCNLFNSVPSSRFAQFTERVPMVKGRRNRKASTGRAAACS
jgi:hypothetical protein